MATIGVRGDNAYVVVEDFAITWTAAAATASAAGGHLVTLADAAEDSFVREVVRGTGIGDYWIGFSDSAEEGSFAWTNGEPVTFTNWGPGEPNDFGTGEDYATGDREGTGQWNDLPLTGADGFEVGGYVVEFDDAAAFGNAANPIRNTGDSFFGSAGADTIRALGGNDTLAGGPGADQLVGGAGNDLFVFRAADGAGRDTILDFDRNGDDVIRLEGFGADFAAVLSVARQVGTAVIIGAAGTSLALAETTLDSLTPDDFLFA